MMRGAAALPVLVTGATGFLGRAVVGALHRAGYPVRAAGGPRSGGAGVTLALDLRDDAQLHDAMHGVQAVIHLAAIGATRAEHDDVATAEINALGALRVARAATAAGVARLLAASTHAVYADQPGLLHESSALGPRGIYASAKLSGEWLAAAACTDRTSCTTVRLFNLYGAHAPPENVVQRFATALGAGAPIALAAPADRLVDLLHVDDAADTLVTLLGCRALPPLLNLGTGIGTPLVAVAHAVARVLGMPEPGIGAADGGTYLHDRVACVARLRSVVPSFAPRAVARGLHDTFASQPA